VRRKNDSYPTPFSEWCLSKLFNYTGIRGSVLDPCCGDGRMGLSLKNRTIRFLESDITEGIDARQIDYSPFDWVVTNPPFNLAFEILTRILSFDCKVAMILRISFLEPLKVDPRGRWLMNNPPDKLLVLPRQSFTGDGKSDSVTCAWCVWDGTGEQIIRCLFRERA